MTNPTPDFEKYAQDFIELCADPNLDILKAQVKKLLETSFTDGLKAGREAALKEARITIGALYDRRDGDAEQVNYNLGVDRCYEEIKALKEKEPV